MMYERRIREIIVQTARIIKLGIGTYAFETSLFGEKPFETNMNMPTFKTEEAAKRWIASTGKWKERQAA